MLNLLDFVVRLNAEARKDLGEDSWCYAFGENDGLLGVFDGCGGSGARKHTYYSGHSEAYMASRLCAGAFFDAFRDASTDPPGESVLRIIARMAQYCQASFAAYRPASDQKVRIRSAMITTLPTTAAAAILQCSGHRLTVTAAWAGDSRVYLLTPDGLSQLSRDDSDDDDPFDTDGMMTNTLNADRAPRIHQRSCRIEQPALVLAATDGCFAYYTTPMEFEGVLLSTMLSASSVAEWEQRLTEQIGMVAGDDYTMTLAAFGFRSFERLKNAFTMRYEALNERYLKALAGLPLSDRGMRRQLWQSYRPGYVRYMEE